MRIRLFPLAMLAVFGVTFVSASFAQTQEGTAKPTQSEEEKKKAEEEKKKAEELKKKIEEYDKFIKDLPKAEGPFTLYRKGKSLYLELPEDKLGKLFLAQVTWNTGVGQNLQAGDPTNYGAVDCFRFDKQEDKLWLVKPNRRYRWSPDDPLNIASQRSFPEAIVGSYAIAQTHPEKKTMLVDVTSFFMGDPFQISQMVQAALSGPYMLDREKSGPNKVKGFPENTVVQMNLNYMSAGGGGGGLPPELAALMGGMPQLEDPRSAPLKLTMNVWYRKDTGYQPRVADQRVGYFTEDFYSVSRFYKTDRTERFINRWNLVKKDPQAAVSDPVKPIVWTLDPSIPERYRPSVRKGILRWNKAFEALGFSNAVQVQDAPKDPDWDHADGRYNVIRWTMTEDAGYAVALFRTDPFTGEILNSSVTMDANFPYYGFMEASDIVGPARHSSSKAMEVLTRSPEKRDVDRYLWESKEDVATRFWDTRARQSGWEVHRCDYGHGKLESSAMAYHALVAGGRAINRETYVDEMIADVISHEVGHTMGLRHNFIASTNFTADQLAKDELTNRYGIAASVMEYTPANIAAVLKGGNNFYSPTIGPYDMWAIRYGYTAAAPDATKTVLSQIAALSTKPGNAFMTDEDADSFNPYVVRFDCAKDPIRWSEMTLEAARRVKDYALKSLPKAGEGPEQRTRLILFAMNRMFREGRLATRFFGGTASRRDYSGATLAPASASDQRAALNLVKKCLSAEGFSLPASVLTSLSRDMNSSTGSEWTAPIREMASTMQMLLLSQSIAASTVDKIAENEFKGSSYGMAEHYDGLFASIFSEIGANRAIAPLRRDLQRFAVDALIKQSGAGSGAVNEDARAMAKMWLSRVGGRVAGATAPDAISRAHLAGLKESIDRFNRRIATGL